MLLLRELVWQQQRAQHGDAVKQALKLSGGQLPRCADTDESWSARTVKAPGSILSSHRQAIGCGHACRLAAAASYRPASTSEASVTGSPGARRSATLKQRDQLDADAFCRTASCHRVIAGRRLPSLPPRLKTAAPPKSASQRSGGTGTHGFRPAAFQHESRNSGLKQWSGMRGSAPATPANR